jgi:hypothetical protein
LNKKSTFSLENQRLKSGKKERFNLSFYRKFELFFDKKGIVIIGEFVYGFQRPSSLEKKIFTC